MRYRAWHHQSHERTTPFHVSCTHRAQFLPSQKPCESTLTTHRSSRKEMAKGNSIYPLETRDDLTAHHGYDSKAFPCIPSFRIRFCKYMCVSACMYIHLLMSTHYMLSPVESILCQRDHLLSHLGPFQGCRPMLPLIFH